MKPMSVLSIAVASALALSAAQAAPVRNAEIGGSVPAGHGAAAALYTQFDNPGNNGAPDQDFEPMFDAYDSSAADDFVVPGSAVTGWTITSVQTVGTTGTPGSATVDVTIRQNSPGGGDPDLPGAAVCTYVDLVPVDTLGSFDITLPTPCIIGPGTYWVELQTAQNFGSNGQHFWSNRSTQTGSESVWRNPGGGFTTPVDCTNFTPQTACNVGSGLNPDFLFQISGTLGGLAPPGPIPTLSNTMMWTLMGLLTVFGLVAVRKRFA